ncbi:MAG: 16S rRNA (cytosine(1402)-N(4))-methyltransferase RsmH [Proteobacteria bacterium]|nr:16S rRNA (cytosine(1402)-N(4))-methyltransferase RsmH [Pseudomonadota bacterium]
MLKHQSVLSKEVLDSLNIVADGYYIDGTFGRGGHSALILAKLGPEGRLLAIDQDPSAIEAGNTPPFLGDSRFKLCWGSFATIGEITAKQGWLGKVHGILLDLGVSSPQLDDPKRGFSFRLQGPLDMRMNSEQGVSAADWLNKAKESDITQVLKDFGEERFARQIAKAIVATRTIKPLATTGQLASLIAATIPWYEPGKHPATRSFQAIRIYINQELESLQAALNQCPAILKKGGRLAVMSFHSLEDRMVKQFIHNQSKGNVLEKLPLKESQIKRQMQMIGRLIRPTGEEITMNPRARSARLRVAEKI